MDGRVNVNIFHDLGEIIKVSPKYVPQQSTYANVLKKNVSQSQVKRLQRRAAQRAEEAQRAGEAKRAEEAKIAEEEKRAEEAEKSELTTVANAAEASKPTEEENTAEKVTICQEAKTSKEVNLIQIESIAKNALRELHHKKEEFIAPETECLVCRQCAEIFKSINEMHSHALGIHKDNLTVNQKEE